MEVRLVSPDMTKHYSVSSCKYCVVSQKMRTWHPHTKSNAPSAGQLHLKTFLIVYIVGGVEPYYGEQGEQVQPFSFSLRGSSAPFLPWQGYISLSSISRLVL